MDLRERPWCPPLDPPMYMYLLVLAKNSDELRISQMGNQSQTGKERCLTLFWSIFLENCMKVKNYYVLHWHYVPCWLLRPLINKLVDWSPIYHNRATIFPQNSFSAMQWLSEPAKFGPIWGGHNSRYWLHCYLLRLEFKGFCDNNWKSKMTIRWRYYSAHLQKICNIAGSKI